MMYDMQKFCHGELVEIVWKGGNGPHRYRMCIDSDWRHRSKDESKFIHAHWKEGRDLWIPESLLDDARSLQRNLASEVPA